MASKPIAQILTANNSIQSMLERAFYLKSLSDGLRDILDPVLATHITVINLRKDTVIVGADSSAWLTKIRYLAPIILQHLQQQPGLEALNKVQFKVLLADHQDSPTIRKATLSSGNAQILQSAAEGMNNTDIANALRRLSRQGHSE